jgi:hypothetical protein
MSIKANIIDFDILKNIRYSDVAFYLSKKGWLRFRDIAGTTIFDSPDDDVRIWLPMKGGLEEDYVYSMGKVISTISTYEDRSELDIVEDFDVFSVGDIIRVSTEDPLDRTSSSLSFDAVIDLINKTKQILLTGASVASSKKNRAYFGSRKPDMATDYINSIRIGQTERGSYIVKALSPLPNELKDDEYNYNLPEFEPSPFERLSVEKSFLGLNNLMEVLEETKKRGKFYIEPFMERVKFGVNADLCEAIIGKDEKINHTPVGFSVSWSPLFKIHNKLDIPDIIKFTPDTYSYIYQAAKEFRKKDPEKVQVTGYIVNLHKESEDGDGEVTVMANVKGKSKKIKMSLDVDGYQLAVNSHKKWIEVSARGVLNKNKLESLSKFSVLDSTGEMFD